MQIGVQLIAPKRKFSLWTGWQQPLWFFSYKGYEMCLSQLAQPKFKGQRNSWWWKGYDTTFAHEAKIQQGLTTRYSDSNNCTKNGAGHSNSVRMCQCAYRFTPYSSLQIIHLLIMFSHIGIKVIVDLHSSLMTSIGNEKHFFFMQFLIPMVLPTISPW